MSVCFVLALFRRFSLSREEYVNRLNKMQAIKPRDLGLFALKETLLHREAGMLDDIKERSRYRVMYLVARPGCSFSDLRRRSVSNLYVWSRVVKCFARVWELELKTQLAAPFKRSWVVCSVRIPIAPIRTLGARMTITTR